MTSSLPSSLPSSITKTSSSPSTLDVAKNLIARPSITPLDLGCQNYIAEYLSLLGFTITDLPFENVQNLFAKIGDTKPLLVFAGHTDVVAPGPIHLWDNDPFLPTVKDGYLYGRGAADMKGSLAAMLTAAYRFFSKKPKCNGSFAFLLTSDEEGPAHFGTRKVIEYLKNSNQPIDYCCIGEPSSTHEAGDVIRVGRRGSLSCRLKIIGIQGHVAYPEKAKNPIHLACNVLKTLTEYHWDAGNTHFPPTSMQISNISSGVGLENVIPHTLECLFNFRFNNEYTADKLQQIVTDILDKAEIQYHCDWVLHGNPYLSSKGILLDAITESITEKTGIIPKQSAEGGSSDGRFIAAFGAEVIELGPCNSTIHSVNECVKIADLDRLSEIYERILERVLLR